MVHVFQSGQLEQSDAEITARIFQDINQAVSNNC